MSVRLRARSSLALSLASLSGCVSSPENTHESSIPEIAGARLELFYATHEPSVRGDPGANILGALEGGAELGRIFVVTDAEGEEIGRTAADGFGRIRITFDGSPGDIAFLGVEDGRDPPVAFRVRDPERARREAVGAPIDGAGTVPNDLAIIGEPGAPRGVLVRSGDNAVSELDLIRGLTEEGRGVRLPDVEGPFGSQPANPWFVAPLEETGSRVAVTAFGQRHVYLIDLDAGRIERTLEMTRAIVLPAPYVLPRGVDTDGDGSAESEVRRFVPRTPQAVAVESGVLAVAFTSFLSPRIDASRGPVYLPGVLALWRLDDLEVSPDVHVLPSLNPQEIRAVGDGKILIVCSGVIDHMGDVVSTTPGAVIVFDVLGRQIQDTLDLGDFGPGTALVAGGAFWVGSIVRGVVRRIDLVDRTRVLDVVLNDEAVDSVFRIVELPGGLIGAPSFNTDRLHVLDPRTGAISPPPFYGPLAVGPGRPIFDGLQIVARRPGRSGVDFTGPDFFALGGIASRVTPIELRKLLGP